MAGLDSNVLVRWLVADDEAQTQRARKVFEAAASGGIALFVPSTVALELEWVLRSRYRLDKAVVLQAFTALLETQELEFQAEEALERALHAYRSGGADFADCLHAGLCAGAGRAPLLSFDEKAARLAGIEPIPA
jgi:predicted nucleic-acid-binding protein